MKIELPFISVITVVFNASKSIEHTILSVINQTASIFEYIVIDGGSTDGTLDIIKKYQHKISYYVSEPDGGIYHAMNKGIAKATGQYVYFINAGDICYKLPIREIQNHKADLICFPVELSNGEIFYPEINNTIRIQNTLPHQGCFYKNTPDLNYNTTYKVFSDFALNQMYYQSKREIIAMRLPVVAFHDMVGVSHNKKYEHEIFRIVYDQFGWVNVLRSYLYFKLNGIKARFQKNHRS